MICPFRTIECVSIGRTVDTWGSIPHLPLKQMYNKLKLKIMSERKSKNIFFIVYGLIVVTMLMCSCTSIHYVCDAYAVNTDKVCENCDEID